MTVLLNIFLYLIIGLVIVLGSIWFKFMPKPEPQHYFAFGAGIIMWPFFLFFIIKEEIKDRKEKKKGV